MNQTNKQISKRDKQEEETLVLLDIAKAIDEVKGEGFGEVRVYVQNGKIYRWELVKSRTRRNSPR